QVDPILKAEPDNVSALMAMGAINWQKGDSAASTQNYEQALAHYPDFVPAKRYLSILYSQAAGNLNPNAYNIAVRAYEAYPNDPEMSKALGIILNRHGDFG